MDDITRPFIGLDKMKPWHFLYQVFIRKGKHHLTSSTQEQEVVFGQALVMDWVYIKRKLLVVACKDGVCTDMFVQEKPGVANHPLKQDNMDKGITWLMCVANYVDDDIHERIKATMVILKRARKAWLHPLCGWERRHKKKGWEGSCWSPLRQMPLWKTITLIKGPWYYVEFKKIIKYIIS